MANFNRNGNAWRDLLEKVSSLQNNSCSICSKYAEVLETFSDIVKHCFSLKLDDNYAIGIKKFKEFYSKPKLKITPKVHAVFYHVEYFCNKKKA